MFDKRYAYFLALISARGRGKTTILNNIVKKAISKGDRVLVIVPDLGESAWFEYPVLLEDEFEAQFDPNFKGVLVVKYDVLGGTTVPFIYHLVNQLKLKDLTLIFDDPKYFQNSPPPELDLLLSRCRQSSIDLVTTVHGYDQIPPPFFTYLTSFGLGYTTSAILNRRPHLSDNYGAHVKARQKINQLANVERDNKNYYTFKIFPIDLDPAIVDDWKPLTH